MDATRWARLEELLEAGAQLPQRDRAAFVRRVTGSDRTLRYELESLLAVYDSSADYVRQLRQEVLGTEVQAILDAPVACDEPDPWIGQTVSHYEITDRIGGGGMGVIYRARDLRLDRQVALKFIAPELHRDSEARRRFQHEARAASALDHPNICTIHDIEETGDGRAFIVMSAYEGVTLRERISRGLQGPSEALDIAGQVARALAAAHERGIVHRDVKPDNIFITWDGVVKLLDFGLAGTTDSAMSGAGGVEGTVAYMSPEQAQGRRAEARSDVWALGVVLYEMLARVRPFVAEGASETVQRILTSDPDLEALPKDTPPGVAALIARALSRDPAARFANGSEFLLGLRAVGAMASADAQNRRSRIRLAGAVGALAVLLLAVSLRERVQAGHAAVEQAVVTSGSARVLWVDDDPSNNEKQIDLLRERGVHVTTAVSTNDALDRYDPAAFDVVVSDMGRPEGPNREYVSKAGLKLLERLRAKAPAVKFILYTTSRSAKAFGDEAKTEGAHAVIVETDELVRVLTEWKAGNQAE